MTRILLIEDDPFQRELYKIVLEQAGYEVLEAPDGKAGLQLFEQQPCGLVITDIFMPEQEGLETISELRKEFLAVKIIAISGGGYGAQLSGSFGADVALEAAKELGANRVLQKPFKIRSLLAIVKDVLDRDT